jgi:hypothetical protein
VGGCRGRKSGTNIIQGVVALFNDDYYATTGSDLFAADYTT